MKYEKLVDRFIAYAKVNTRSNETSTTIPSDPKEVAFLAKLASEIKELGFADVRTMKDGYLFARIPASKGKETVDPIGFIAHVDTADFNAENIQPEVHENYDGESVIKLNDDYNLDPAVFPNLHNYKGHTLITTDGTTLLGADDKAGVAEIITAMSYLLDHPQIQHGEIEIAFGPDEEIGVGADHFDTKNFAAKFAFTVDGSIKGELEWATFSASAAVIKAVGTQVHPSSGFGKLINPLIAIIDVFNLLPNERPENTKGDQGYYYLLNLDGDGDSAMANLIIRDFKRDGLAKRKQILADAVKKVNSAYPHLVLELSQHDQYYNMADILKDHMESVHLAEAAFKALSIEADEQPVRGGTDGSKITFLGLPTPNIFTGAENLHGRYEFASVQDMELATDVILKIIELHSK
ncbi:peptidase T [Oenococcus sicerae]|uniref:Peptidase T n=1 Tax=Oenococcus sicerae TaxID=2203724 RepID=A0AAJ1R7V6_9LACO|nr:peptidase T [Oenococcus sicerae]MDN6899744.1 peptidase T [Oenococcus sicerae]QAS70433.1 peptidase T [Oenococcus sicerae]VDK14157.1 Peptidase T {ECO:0000255/HAMAP-Rule:MF_00550} [Oenococcus sicerae]